MTPDELYAHLLLVPDATQEIVRMCKTKRFTQAAARTAAWTAAQDAARDAARDAALDAAWNAARGAAQDAAWNAARTAAWDTAWNAAQDAALLAGCMVVRDVLDKKHMDIALSNFCELINEKE